MPQSEQASPGHQTEEQRRWNDPAWTASWPRREALTSEVTAFLLDRLAPLEGAQVLEVGSGGGSATFALAERVGGGSVTGADISVALCELARRRATERGVTNASFVVADAQRDRVPGGPFTTAASQFGVMFFDDPVEAFANIRSHLAPGAPLGFACWREASANPWMVGATIAAFLPPGPDAPPGPPSTGPFSLADPAATAALLEAAGWDEVRCTPHDLVVAVGQEVLFDEASLRFFGVPEDRLDAAGEAVLDQLRPLARPDGRYDAPLAFQVVTATAPA